MQRSPAEPAPPPQVARANCMSASGSTTAWFFAPRVPAPFSIRSCSAVDVPSDRSRTDNETARHRRDRAVHRQQLCRRAERSTPRAEVRPLQTIRRATMMQMDSFRWFQHEGISACDCNWEHPHRHHRRKAEWRDSDTNAKRLAERTNRLHRYRIGICAFRQCRQ